MWLLTSSGQHQVWILPPEEGAEGGGDRGCFGFVCVCICGFKIAKEKYLVLICKVREYSGKMAAV